MRFRSRYKTARCVLHCQSQFFLAIHSSFRARKHKRWGLPGGGIERREEPEDAVRRELVEELELYLSHFTQLGPYTYKGADHMVYGAEVDALLTTYDDTELLDIGWFSFEQVREMKKQNKLHAGYEFEAIQAYVEYKNKLCK